MTPSINLLPWRECRRRRRNGIFLLQLGAVLAAGLGVLVGLGQHLGGAAQAQQDRNAMLREQLAQLEDRIVQAQALQRRRQGLVGRIRSIQALEAQQFSVVGLLNELATGVPNGLHYEFMELHEDALTLKGVAQGADSVSALLRALQGSPWFSGPRLISIDHAGAFHISAVWRGGCPADSVATNDPGAESRCQ